MEPIEPGSPPTQGPETGAAPESQWPGLWDDLASVKALAERAQGVPNLRHLSLALVALCQVVENLAQRVEALESPKPCEGCGEGVPVDGLVAALAKAIEDGKMPELVAAILAKEPEKNTGLLRRTFEAVGLKVGG